MKNRILLIIVIILVQSCWLAANCQEKQKLVIGVKESPPFVIKTTEGYTGVCIDLWNDIAGSLDIEYEYREYDLTQLLNAIDNSEIDLSINPLTVTAERMKRFSFTQPFYITNLGIATKTKDKSVILVFLKNMVSFDFMKAVLLLLLIIFIFGFILWLVERRRNSEQFHKGAKGIGDGVWWSAVTMTTVGYGDKAPKTGLGRVISFIWMFTAIVVISGFTAGIASSLTINQLESNITGINDLKEVKVGTIANSASADFLAEYGIMYKEYTEITNGLEAVDKGNIKAFVYDEAILRYMIHDLRLNEKIMIIPSAYSKEYFSFASKDDELIIKINPVLIQKIEAPSYKDILEKYKLDYQD